MEDIFNYIFTCGIPDVDSAHGMTYLWTDTNNRGMRNKALSYVGSEMGVTGKRPPQILKDLAFKQQFGINKLNRQSPSYKNYDFFYKKPWEPKIKQHMEAVSAKEFFNTNKAYLCEDIFIQTFKAYFYRFNEVKEAAIQKDFKAFKTKLPIFEKAERDFCELAALPGIESYLKNLRKITEQVELCRSQGEIFKCAARIIKNEHIPDYLINKSGHQISLISDKPDIINPSYIRSECYPIKNFIYTPFSRPY